MRRSESLRSCLAWGADCVLCSVSCVCFRIRVPASVYLCIFLCMCIVLFTVYVCLVFLSVWACPRGGSKSPLTVMDRRVLILYILSPITMFYSDLATRSWRCNSRRMSHSEKVDHAQDRRTTGSKVWWPNDDAFVPGYTGYERSIMSLHQMFVRRFPLSLSLREVSLRGSSSYSISSSLSCFVQMEVWNAAIQGGIGPRRLRHTAHDTPTHIPSHLSNTHINIYQNFVLR